MAPFLGLSMPLKVSRKKRSGTALFMPGRPSPKSHRSLRFGAKMLSLLRLKREYHLDDHPYFGLLPPVSTETIIPNSSQGPNGTDLQAMQQQEPVFTCFPMLPIEIKLKIFALVERPPRIIMFRKVYKRLFSRPNKPIPTEVISRESRMVRHPNIFYYLGMSIDFDQDTFLVRDENTLACLLSREPLLARQIHTLAIETLDPFERNYAHLRVVRMARHLGHLENLILCKGWLEMMEVGGGNFDDAIDMWFWLMTKNADDEDRYLNMSTPTLLWRTPMVYFLPGTYLEPYSVETEVAKWVEMYKTLIHFS